MKFNLKFFSFCILFFFFSLHGIAQVNSLTTRDLSTIHIDEISDDEIKSYLTKARDNGLSDQDIFKLLEDRGLPKEQIAKLTDRISLMNIPNRTQQQDDKKLPEKSNKETTNKERYENKDATNMPRQAMEADLSVFGSELFTSSSLVFEPNLRIPAPAGYVLGPDDQLIINVFGYSEKTYNVSVNEEGNIYLPQVGPIYVNGLNMERATTKIKAKLASTIYKAINSGQTTVQISLGKIRSIRVTVIGEAKKPGTLTVSSLTTLFNLLYLCGGPSDFGSYRKIELIRGNELKRTIDLYAFLLRGDQKDNLLLQEGDVIRIPYYQTRITLNGNVKRKGKYELIEGESFENVLQFSGGFADDAYKGGITVYQLTDTERKMLDVTKEQYNHYKPSSSDSIVVGKLLDRYENKLTLRGAIMRPGEYALTTNLNLKQLIEKAGGVKEDVYSRRGSIKRLNHINMPTQVSFNLDSVLNNLVNIPLRKNDDITIYSIFDLKANTEVSIDGFIFRPGKYKWTENLTLHDVILEAGGITDPGNASNIEIARRIENIDWNTLNHLQAEILTIDLSDSAAINDVKLKPYDVINIRQRPGFLSQRTVFLEGMVVNPGRYTLKKSDEKISDVIQRAGRFRPNADTSALLIRRLVKKNQSQEERERVFSKVLKIQEDSINTTPSIRKEIFKNYENISIDLAKALQEPLSRENMLLEDGDVLSIEQNTNLVKVTGEVYFPTIIPFKENASLKYYIEKSGSYTPLARKKGALVIYPDGKAKKVSHFLFFKSYPRVVSRSEIFVPQKSENNRQRVTVGEWAVVLSSLAIIANVIVNLSK
ncbi:MAG: SLBB domain-containing protein [Ferruginibacter sp.]